MEKQTKWTCAALIEAFGAHLQTCCGSTPGTCHQYVRYAREFLQAIYGEAEVDLTVLEPLDLTTFVSERSRHYKPKTSQLLASALRSLARFLQLRGLCNSRLVEAVPTIANWKLSDLPLSLTDDQLNQVLGSFDQSTATGKRNYVMAVCMAELGLRAGEVASLSLDDIDWRAGTLMVPTQKRRHPDTLPLPPKVGRAIVTYLRHGRPCTAERRLFVSHAVPAGALIKTCTVRAAMYEAFDRAGVNTPSKGSHILRHTAATRMIRGGATLKQIADVLRHKHIDTTAIYAKVDTTALSEVAMPWPEVQP